MRSQMLYHPDGVSGTTILPDGTKCYWTEGRSGELVFRRPGQEIETIPVYQVHPILAELTRIEETGAYEGREMADAEVTEFNAARGWPQERGRERKMKIVVEVEPKVVAGTDRGGEDLYLAFSAKTDHVPTVEELSPTPGFALLEIEIKVDLAAYDHFTEKDGRLSYLTEYDFEWEGTREDLAALVRPLLLQMENWSRPARGDGGSFQVDHYVDGNAD